MEFTVQYSVDTDTAEATEVTPTDYKDTTVIGKVQKKIKLF